MSNTLPPEAGIELIKQLVQRAANLDKKIEIQAIDLTAWDNLARDYLSRIFGTNSHNVQEVLNAAGGPHLRVGVPKEMAQQYRRQTLLNKLKLLESCAEQLRTDINLRNSLTQNSINQAKPQSSPNGSKIFIVHGRNHGIKETIARFLEKLELEPVILHEQPNSGRTTIEKFSDYANVNFAIVLLTGDDEGRLRDSGDNLTTRARAIPS